MRFFFSFFWLWLHFLFAQGCSDAGFCTLGSLRPNQSFQKKGLINVKSLEITQYFGVAEFKDSNHKPAFYDNFLSTIADLNLSVGKNNAFQMKLPYNTTIGNLETTHGFGDISMSWTRLLTTIGYSRISFVTGGKVPTSFGNRRQSVSDRPLPMYYQPSLGTFDAVFGASLQNRDWLFACGVQLPFYQDLENRFVWSPWNNTEDSAIARTYPRSYQLKRGNDVMVRVEKNFRFTNWNFFVGILPILRLNEDEFFNPASQTFEKVKGSAGLATTALSGFGYRIRTHSSIKALVGVRVTKREQNPDGLSRIFVTTIGYEYLF